MNPGTSAATENMRKAIIVTMRGKRSTNAAMADTRKAITAAAATSTRCRL